MTFDIYYMNDFDVYHMNDFDVYHKHDFWYLSQTWLDIYHMNGFSWWWHQGRLLYIPTKT